MFTVGARRWLFALAITACSSSDPEPEIGTTTGPPSDSSDGGESESSGPSMAHATNGTCVEHGMRFLNVYGCDTVIGPAPKQPPGSTAMVPHDPAVLDDPDYGWVLAQIEACSCTCCHSEGAVGSYVWSHDFTPAWTDSIASADLDTLAYDGRGNAVAPEDNFGFSRAQSGLPTTDVARLQAFVERELTRRDGG